MRMLRSCGQMIDQSCNWEKMQHDIVGDLEVVAVMIRQPVRYRVSPLRIVRRCDERGENYAFESFAAPRDALPALGAHIR
jgi:hypothetical protein